MAFVFLLGLLSFERKSVTKGILLTKPIVSLLFVVTALVQNPLSSGYFSGILMALILSLIGDVCLIFTDSRKMFLAGLLSSTGRYMVLIGALSFYASDIFVARNQFVIDTFVNRWIGLPLYYLAQFLFAISTAHIG